MTPERMRIKIAEACGITPRKVEVLGMKDVLWFDKDGKMTFCPNYPTSLDAMAEARKTLSAGEMEEYDWTLRWTIAESNKESVFTVSNEQIINATPIQHAEAFLRAKGLWEEET